MLLLVVFSSTIGHHVKQNDIGKKLRKKLTRVNKNKEER
jgi:hypothetical protein